MASFSSLLQDFIHVCRGAIKWNQVPGLGRNVLVPFFKKEKAAGFGITFFKAPIWWSGTTPISLSQKAKCGRTSLCGMCVYFRV